MQEKKLEKYTVVSILKKKQDATYFILKRAAAASCFGLGIL